MNQSAAHDESTPFRLIDRRIKELAGWRGKMLAKIRKIVLKAAPELTEEWKWDTPVWSHNGNVVAAGAFQDHLKLNFFKGAKLEDPHKLFNAGLDAKTTRAIDLFEGDRIDEAALRDLVRAAVALNGSKSKAAIPGAPHKSNTKR
jgi:hypothetical protein